MADDDPRRLDEIRKYAAIYGRFDCKRKPEKPLTLHEVSDYFSSLSLSNINQSTRRYTRRRGGQKKGEKDNFLTREYICSSSLE